MSANDEFDDSACSDFSFFKDLLKKWRKIDDNIIHALNTTNTHSPEQCRELFQQLSEAWTKREDSIRHCIGILDRDIDVLKEKVDKEPDNDDAYFNLDHVESQRRLIRKELGVEEIVRDRTKTEFKKRCRSVKIPKRFE